MKLAITCPGQGSQFVGMGRDLAEAFEAARLVFEEVDEALSFKLSQLMWEGPIESLTLTEHTQPALMAHSLAVMHVLRDQGGYHLPKDTVCVAGHSLGEYSALAIADALSIADIARLLRIRGQAMQAAVKSGDGAMAAILGLDLETVKNVVEIAGNAGVCAIANDNSTGQVVVSGVKAAVEKAIEESKSRKARRAILLNVSAPFHCPLMKPAEERMAQELARVKLNRPSVPVVANVLAQAISEPQEIFQSLVAQICGTVRWRETGSYFSSTKIEEVLELGAGNVLTGLAKRNTPEARATPIGTLESVEAFLNR